MTTHITLLRAINLPRHGKVAMADLRAFMTALGFEDVRVLLQTGNVVFGGGTSKGAALEKLLESEAEKRLGLRTDFMVRTAKEWDAIIAANPFPNEAKDDPSHLVVMVLKAAPAAGGVKALQAAIKGREIVRVEGKQLYITYPDGIGRSKLTAGIIEKHVAARGTGRNWNTVLKIAALANG
jgi:uncharacterized protein (DUF1697 family)